jgi:O-antigen ligase
MTDINAVHEGTGQSRIQIWSDSLSIWRQYPVFGLGEGLIVDEIGMVSHNSFIQCYAELGIFGGTAFTACFLAAGLNLWARRHERDDQRLRGREAEEFREVAHLRGFVFAALVAAGAGMLTISRQFVAPTYLILGLAAVAQSLPQGDTVRWRIGNRFLVLAVAASGLSLITYYLLVRLFVRW